ncbi:GLPGLI family protein [Ferruginibacter profundus]
MKKIIALLVAAVMAQYSNAQVNEGKVAYDEIIDMHRRIPKENEEMKAMIPQYRTNKFELSFADNKSLYKAAEEEPDLSEQQGGGIVMRFAGNDNIFYKDFTTQTTIEKKSLMEKEFIVEDSIRNIPWKLVDGETKTIAGHVCKKATGKSQMGLDMIAWYAEDIALSSGPAQFGGLPGLILGMDVNQGEFVYTATTIDKTVKKTDLKAPAKGKKVTPAEFAKARKELMGDGNGPVRIVTN